MSKERLEQIKDAVAHELGLTDDYMDGTYLYHLTRSKSAFAVGTMTLDDFKEIDEELLDEIFNAIEPFFIEQAERVQELEDKLARIRFVNSDYDKINKRYREALEEIKQEGEFMDFRTGRKIYNTQGRIACEALEGF